VKNAALSSTFTNRLLIVAQLLALTALALGLNFLIRTSGGTLFLFASVAPVLVFIAIVILAGVGIQRYNASHHLFDVETYAPGEAIIRQGDPGVCAYFIQEGQVEVVRQEQGQDQVIATLGKDEYFGEMALLSSAPRNATVRAQKETRVAALGKDNFIKLLAVLPQTQESILRTVQARAKQVAAGK
jgi:CRP/FNR family cyclic AMP-dependent transcriptional regulator